MKLKLFLHVCIKHSLYHSWIANEDAWEEYKKCIQINTKACNIKWVKFKFKKSFMTDDSK